MFVFNRCFRLLGFGSESLAKSENMCIFAGILDKIMANVVNTATSNNDRLQRINLMVSSLEEEQQVELERQLRILLLLNQAQEIDGSVKKNDISMAEIVEEVRRARHGN